MTPDSWHTVRLQDCLEKIIDYRGKSPPKSDIGVPLITARNVREGFLDFATQEYIDASEYDQWMSRGLPKAGDLLFTTEAPLGMVALFPEDGKYAIAQRLVNLRTKQGVADSKYLLYYFLSERGSHQVQLRSTGSTATGIRQSELRKVPILLPSFPEQRKVAEILGTWDKAIALVERRIEAAQQRKKGLMQRLLTGRVRVPEFEGEEWREVALGDLGETYSGLRGKSRDDFGQGKPYIPYLNIYNNWAIDPEQMDYVSIEDGERQNRVKYGDILFTTSSETPDEVGMSSVLLNHLGETYLNSFCYGFRLNGFSQLLPEYAVYLLRGEDFRHAMHYLAQGATRYNLTKRYLLEASLRLPPLAEQRRIAAVLQTCDREIELLQQKRDALQRQKKGLMQRLLTGRVRVEV